MQQWSHIEFFTMSQGSCVITALLPLGVEYSAALVEWLQQCCRLTNTDGVCAVLNTFQVQYTSQSTPTWCVRQEDLQCGCQEDAVVAPGVATLHRHEHVKGLEAATTDTTADTTADTTELHWAGLVDTYYKILLPGPSRLATIWLPAD